MTSEFKKNGVKCNIHIASIKMIPSGNTTLICLCKDSYHSAEFKIVQQEVPHVLGLDNSLQTQTSKWVYNWSTQQDAKHVQKLSDEMFNG